MTFRERFPDVYTSAPGLRRGAIRATLQLAGWLFFHPSAWRAHIARIEPSLQPDFSLAQLTRAQLRNPEVRRLLFLGHVVGPLLLGALLTLELLLLGVPARFVAIRVVACVVMSIGGSLIFGTGSADAVGIASGLMGGLLGCAAFALAVALTGQVVFPLEGTVAAAVSDFLAGGPAGLTMVMVAFGVAVGGMFVAVGGVGAGVSPRRARLSRRPHLGGVLIGLCFGLLCFAAAAGAAVFLPFYAGVTWGGFFAGVLSAVWLSRNWPRSILFGLLCALNNHLLVNLIAPLSHDVAVVGIIMGIILGAWFALPYILAEEIAGSWAGALGGSLGLSGGWMLMMSAASREHVSFGSHLLPGLISMEAGVLLGLTEVFWRPLLLFPLEEAWGLLLLRADQAGTRAPDRPSWLRYHAAFWDEHQRWPLYGLDEHLVLVMERDPAEGHLALEHLASGPQRWAARAAQIELSARRLERCADVQALCRAHRDLGTGELEGPASALLGRFSRASMDVEAALFQASSHNQRLGLSAVQQRLDTLLGEIDRSSDRYAQRLRQAAVRWRQVLAAHAQHLTESAELLQEIDNPYVIGVPLTLEQELFVGRTDVSARIEQLLLDRRRPPLLLHGQRRMGKTSLLHNLGRLLPSTIVPLFVDLQGPASAASDHAGLLYNLARGMIDSARRQRGIALPPLSRERLADDPFTRFDEWLDQVEAALQPATALLTLDEFEALDRAMEDGRFSERDVLGMLRHIVQHRQRIKTLIASSYTLEELGRWSSYLINVQVIELSYLRQEEARRLIEQPVSEMALRYEPAATEQVLTLTRGHPFLVQLLCSEIVSLKNEQEPALRRLATVADVFAAVPLALRHGSFFFVDIERNQVDALGLALLRWLAGKGEGASASLEDLASHVPGDVAATLQRIGRRGVIGRSAAGYHFEVELIRRWFTQEP